MGLFAWLERKLWLGDVLKDYGVLDEKESVVGSLRTSVLLCRRGGKLRLVLRSVGKGPMSASVSYAMIDATPEALAKLGEVVLDALEEIRQGAPPA